MRESQCACGDPAVMVKANQCKYCYQRTYRAAKLGIAVAEMPTSARRNTTAFKCFECGKPNSHNVLRCQDCRRVNPTDPRTVTIECASCHKKFRSVRTRTRYCSRQCFGTSTRKYRSEPLTHKQRRDARESIIGLTRLQRRTLLHKWIRQSRTCSYCDQLATTVDHIIPLARGGTNYEGNLAPACVHCNSSRRDKTLTEWHAWRNRNLAATARTSA